MDVTFHESERIKKQFFPTHEVKLVSEEPRYRLVRCSHQTFYIAIPFTHYLLIRKPDSEKWFLSSVYMSPRSITKVRFRKVSKPILPNFYSHAPLFRPCQSSRGRLNEDINHIIANFWGGRFNGDLSPVNHTVAIEISNPGQRYARTGIDYFKRWEEVSIDELLGMNWPQDVLV